MLQECTVKKFIMNENKNHFPILVDHTSNHENTALRNRHCGTAMLPIHLSYKDHPPSASPIPIPRREQRTLPPAKADSGTVGPQLDLSNFSPQEFRIRAERSAGY